MADEKMDRGKPSGERQLATMHHRAGRHRGLPTATGAFPSEPLSRQFPAPHPAASRADEPDRPTPLKQMPRACRFVRKTLCELSTRHRTIILPPARHENIIVTFFPAVKRSHCRRVPSLDGAEPKG